MEEQVISNVFNLAAFPEWCIRMAEPTNRQRLKVLHLVLQFSGILLYVALAYATSYPNGVPVWLTFSTPMDTICTLASFVLTAESIRGCVCRTTRFWEGCICLFGSKHPEADTRCVAGVLGAVIGLAIWVLVQVEGRRLSRPIGDLVAVLTISGNVGFLLEAWTGVMERALERM